MTDTSKALTPRDGSAVLEQVVVQGDLGKLSAAERISYYRQVCESLGLNPLTQPFQYITLNSKLTLYAGRGCTDQLRRVHKVNLVITARERQDDVYVVTARATVFMGTPSERSDESIGAVAVAGLKGDALANALMKAETKAKRRATLSIVGLGWLDEAEVETIPDARLEPMAAAAPADVAPPASPVGPTKRHKAFLDRYGVLYQEAIALGLKPKTVRDSESDEAIAAAGQALAGEIANWKAEHPDVPAEEPAF